MDESSGEVTQMLKKLPKALKANPKDERLHDMAASLYEQVGRYGEAVSSLAFLVSKTSPPDERLYARYVKALQRSLALNKALQAVDDGLKVFPQSTALLRSKAMSYLLLGHFEEAKAIYRELCARDHADEHSAGMAGTLTLLLTNMEKGYDQYQLRPLDENLAKVFDGIPRWGGEDVRGKKVVLWSEQGVGDVMMFLGLVPWFVKQEPSISLVVTAKLAPFVARSFTGVEVISEGGLRGLDNRFDFHLPMGDLLRYARTGYVPAGEPPYLVADAQRSGRLRESYLSYARQRNRHRLVGLAWHTTNPEVGFTRNVSLAELQPLLSVPGVQFISLQYGEHGEEIAECNRRTKDILYKDVSIDAFEDLDGLAAQMAAVDEVVTIDNATVHMAGALGVATTLLLSTMPDWRWGLTGSECRWYRSVRLERQEALLKWQPVVKRLRARMMNVVGKPQSSIVT